MPFSKHCIDLMIQIYSTWIEPVLDLDFIDNASMDHDNTSLIDKVYNSYQCGLGLCDCLGTHSLTFPPSITSLNNCTNKETITSIIFSLQSKTLELNFDEDIPKKSPIFGC